MSDKPEKGEVLVIQQHVCEYCYRKYGVVAEPTISRDKKGNAITFHDSGKYCPFCGKVSLGIIIN